MFESKKVAARCRKALVATSLAMGIQVLGSTAALSQGGPAEAAAVAGVIISVVGGLSSWLEKNSDDSAVAAMGAAWGADVEFLVLVPEPGVDPERLDPHDLLLFVSHRAGYVHHVEEVRITSRSPAGNMLR